MTREEFRRMSRKTILLDGATGTNLILAGMPRGVCTELWVLEHKDIIMKLQKAYAKAGSQIVYAPTFGANARSLHEKGVWTDVPKLNKELVELTRAAVEGNAFVAGNLTTSGRIPEVFGDYTYEDALEMYKEQIWGLKEGGADILVAETMISIDEAAALVEAAKSVCELPILCSMTVEADGSIFSGGNIADAVETLQELGADAVGINCSVGPDQLEAVVAVMKKTVQIPVMVKPNAGMPVITETGEAVYSMNSEDFTRHMERLVETGASIIGGCCGTTPAYIAELYEKIIKKEESRNLF